MTPIRKSLALLSALILAAPFYLANQATAGVGGSDHYDGNNYKRYNEGFYPSSGAGVVERSAIGAIGSSVSTLPGNCVAVTYGGVAYRKCGNYWMQPRYRGSNVVYVRVKRPH